MYYKMTSLSETRIHFLLFCKIPKRTENILRNASSIAAAAPMWLHSLPLQTFYQDTVCRFHGGTVVLTTATYKTPHGKEISQISVLVVVSFPRPIIFSRCLTCKYEFIERRHTVPCTDIIKKLHC